MEAAAIPSRGSGSVRARLPGRLLSDQRLASMATAGDRRAFTEIYERYHQPLYRYCRALLRHDDDARDALQNTMLKAIGALPGETRTIELKPWLYRIAHNESISILRARVPSAELDESSLGVVAGADRVAADRERLRGLVSDLSKLSEQQRGALVLKELGGLDFSEIATTFGVSPGAARQAVYKARLALHQLVEGRDMECDAARQTISEADGRLLAARKIRAHLRSCDPCRDFRTAIGARTKDLHALAPALAAPLAAKMLASIVGAGRDGAGAGGVGALLSGGGAKLAGGSLAVKAAAVGAAALVAGAGVVGIETALPGEPGSSGAARVTDHASAHDGMRDAGGSHAGSSSGGKGDGVGNGDSSKDGSGGRGGHAAGAHPGPGGASPGTELPGPPSGVGPPTSPGASGTAGVPGGEAGFDAGLGSADQIAPGGLPEQSGQGSGYGPSGGAGAPTSLPASPGAGAPAGPPHAPGPP